MAERAVHRFQHILRAGEVLLERIDAGELSARSASDCLLARMSSMWTSRSARPRSMRLEMAEPRIGSVEPFDQLDDAIFEMVERDVVAARLLDLLDLVGQRLHQRFQPRRHRSAVLRALGERAAQRGDPVLEAVERVAAGGRGQVLDLLGQHAAPARRARATASLEATCCAMSRNVVIACSSCCSVAGIFLRDDQIDLVREAVDRLVEADQIFRRRQPAQRVAHFGQAVLDAGERAAVDAGLAAFGDALGEALDLLLDRVDGVARHRVVERAADLAELAAQRVDRLFDARLAQRLDLVGDRRS